MKVSIDNSRCEGRGYCAKFAPNVFEIDEFGYGRVKIEGDLPENLIEEAKSGLDACPEQAIRIHD